MRSHLKILAQHEDTKELYVSATCTSCYTIERFVLPFDAWERWQKGELIQNCFPQLTPAEREILISGICGECFDKMFKEEGE